ncbi:MAG: HEAT repeat domain-containing protein, partial [Gemmatimonadales bacterium]
AFLISDEIYQITGPYSRNTHRVLLSLDMSNLRNRQVEGVNRKDGDFAISWIKRFGQGRVFYCSLGHNLDVLRNSAVLAHYLAGIQYAIGDLEVDDVPSGTLSTAPVVALTTDPDAVDDPYASLASLEFGSSRLPRATIEEWIRHAPPEQHRAIEDRLLEILTDPASTYEAKQFICRMLRRIGSEHSLPHLAQLLRDEQLTDDARFALQGHASPEVDVILRESLNELSGHPLVGVVGSIGQRRDREAVPQLAGLIDPADSALTAAIVVALGEIGDEKAMDALMAIELPAGMEQLGYDALLRCADRLAEDGLTREALGVYRRMASDGLPTPVQVAAWRGLVHTRQNEAARLLVEMLQSSQAEIRRAGARSMVEMADLIDLMPVVEQLESLSDDAQGLAIAALASAKVLGATPMVTELLDGGAAPVRTAAILALGDLGDASHVPRLAEIAVAGDDADSLAARDALVSVWGEDVDEQLVAAASRHEGDARAVLLGALADRYAVSAVPAFLEYAEDPDEAVRLAAIAALSRLAEDYRLPTLIVLLERSQTDDDRHALEAAIVAVTERMADREAGLEMVLAALDGGSTSHRVSLLRVVGNWPDAAPLQILLGLAGSVATSQEREAAIAGVLTLMGLPHERTSAEEEHLFASLLAAARTTVERRLVLEGLADRGDVWIFEMVEPFLTDPELGEAAQLIRAHLVETVARTVSHDAVGRPVTLAVPYAPQYDGGGANALTDGVWGSTNPADGTWQGFEGEDLDAVIDLGQSTDITSIRAGFLEANGSWIFLPQEVTFSIAGEDEVYEVVASFTLPVPEERQPNATRSVSTELAGKTARYVRVVARNIGDLPAWHSAAGGRAWLFADEIQVNAHLEER